MNMAAAIFCSAFFLVVLFPAFASAESIFLKDGSIVEGRISHETDAMVRFEIAKGGTRDISRADIIRISNDSGFRSRQFLNKVDGSALEAYIVEQDSRYYTYRVNLHSPEELKILKTEVATVTKRKQRFGATEDPSLTSVFLANGQIVEGKAFCRFPRYCAS